MFGPVFRLELTTQARSPRTYVLRVVYGLGLLALVASAYRGAFPDAGDSPTPAGSIGAFSRSLFEGLALAQGAAVVLLAPALAAGAIAGEAQRKTLDDLLTTELTAVEVVADEAAARLALVGSVVLAGLPVLLLSAEFGGYGTAAAFGVLAATGSTAFFLGGLALLASTQARSVRGAMNATMTVGLSWLIIPSAVEALLPRAGEVGVAVFPWVKPITGWAAASSPFGVWLKFARGALGTPDLVLGAVGWMIGLQVAFGALWVGLAASLLRPGSRPRTFPFRKSRRSERARPDAPPCGDDPMIWKELRVPKAPAVYRPLALLTGIALASMLVGSTAGYAAAAFREVLVHGYGVAAPGSARADFLLYLRIVGTGAISVYLLGVASDAAASMTSERERDTWVSLVATPLTGPEIVRAKLLSAIHGTRHTAVAFGGLVALGVAAGSVHPWSIIIVVVEFVGFTFFAAALGACVSLRAPSTTRALSTTVLLLVALNAGGLLISRLSVVGRPFAFAACGPAGVAVGLASHGDLAGVPSFGSFGGASDEAASAAWTASRWRVPAACLAGAVAYASAGAWLFRSTSRGFDAAIDRPKAEAQGVNCEAMPVTARPIGAKPRAARRAPPATRRRYGLKSAARDDGKSEPGGARDPVWLRR